MERLDRTAIRAVRSLIAAQPVTEAKVRFAWNLAAGPTLARATRVSWSDGTLRVEAASEAWRQELTRARPVLASRVDDILGPGVVRAIEIVASPAARAAQGGRFSR